MFVRNNVLMLKVREAKVCNVKSLYRIKFMFKRFITDKFSMKMVHMQQKFIGEKVGVANDS